MEKEEKRKTKKQQITEKLNKFCEKTKEIFTVALDRDGVIGSIGEIYDTKAPFSSKGTTAQGWSVAEVYIIILEK